MWAGAETGNRAGISCHFCFQTISKGLLCSSDDCARKMLQLQVCRQGWDSLDQPGVPTLALTFGHSVLPAAQFRPGRWKRSNCLRSSKLKYLSALSSPALGSTVPFSIPRMSKTYPGLRNPPKSWCPPHYIYIYIYLYIYTRAHPALPPSGMLTQNGGVVKSYFSFWVLFSPNAMNTI